METNTRNCPTCNVVLRYTNKKSKNAADTIKSSCIRCSKLNRNILDLKKESDLYYKICPTCINQKLYYTTKEGIRWSLKNKTKCKFCKLKNKVEIVYKRNCPKCNVILTTENKYFFKKSVKRNSKCLSCSLIGRKFDDVTREKMSKNHADVSGSKNPFFKKIHSDELLKKLRNPSDFTRQKLREARLKSMSLTGKVVNFNPIACKYFDELSKQNGWNLQHALNGGEIEVCGYSLDAYDKEKNIVVEYDEPKHYKNRVLREKDIKRQNKIIQSLHCMFFRYDENRNILYEIQNEKNNKN